MFLTYISTQPTSAANKTSTNKCRNRLFSAGLTLSLVSIAPWQRQGLKWWHLVWMVESVMAT